MHSYLMYVRSLEVTYYCRLEGRRYLSLFHLFPVKIKEGMLLDGLCVLNVAETNTSISLQQLDMVECMIVRVYYIYYTCMDNGCTYRYG